MKRYTTTAIVLHWLMALLIFCIVPLGLYMSDLKLSPVKLQLFSYHKWIGVTLLMLVLLRILWRLTHKPPAFQAGVNDISAPPSQPSPANNALQGKEQTNADASYKSMPPWQQHASHAVHVLLYVLLLAIPVSGWLMSSAKGFQTVWLGIVPLPDLIAKNRELGNMLEELHANWSYLLMLFAALHIAAALKHRYIDRDEVLSRMLPWGRS